eukprot:CAMPEP_0172763696 /NCGR_PEP_ID=MMETSP1074-20121228/175859_1 /TAXON_ID=2916 /ORGANISM="Ceratium fusus, Strain PA161109" /LENGTH=90 /DNA_ID=CAMNT_0013598329 /DNA_START=707 /DNA_END=976 /DNA_ORIENTATION=+
MSMFATCGGGAGGLVTVVTGGPCADAEEGFRITSCESAWAAHGGSKPTTSAASTSFDSATVAGDRPGHDIFICLSRSFGSTGTSSIHGAL